MDITRLNFLLNVRKSSMICNCGLHHNEQIEQIDAQLPNGKPIRVLRDSYGYHVAIGDWNSLGDFRCPPPVSEADAARMIQSALVKG